VKNQNAGRFTTSSTDQRKQNFYEVLNKEEPDNPVHIEEADEISEINTRDDKRYKNFSFNGNAPAIDNITAEKKQRSNQT
jgi:hypothetical protein